MSLRRHHLSIRRSIFSERKSNRSIDIIVEDHDAAAPQATSKLHTTAAELSINNTQRQYNPPNSQPVVNKVRFSTCTRRMVFIVAPCVFPVDANFNLGAKLVHNLDGYSSIFFIHVSIV